MSRTLFQIGDDEVALYEFLAERDDLDNADEVAKQALDKWIEDLGEERDRKLNSIGWLVRQLEGDSEIRSKEITRLQKLNKTDENIIKRIKLRLLSYLTLTNQKKVQTDHFKIGRRGNGGVCPVILSEQAKMHPEELPERYRRVVFEPKLDAIRADLERAVQIVSNPSEIFTLTDGEELFEIQRNLDGIATLGSRGEHVEIR